MAASGVLAAPDQRLTPQDYTGYVLPAHSGYGTAMASSGDWMAVGAPRDDQDTNSTYRGGRVLLWKREAGIWKFKQQIVSPGSGRGNQFGRTLAMEGTRLLIGAAGTLGTALVYSLQQDVWTLEGTLAAAPGSPTNAGFGDSLALSGDLAIISSPSGSIPPSTTPVGWVDLYAREADGWVYKTRLRDATAGNFVGASVAMHGQMILIGCPNTDLPAAPPSPVRSNVGKVAVFEKSGSTWTKTRDVFSSDPTSGDAFGGKIHVHDGKLYVISPSTTLPKLDELSISGGFNRTQLVYPPYLGTQNIFIATNGTRLVVGSQSFNSLSVFRRAQGGDWISETHDLNDSPSGVHRAALWDGDQLIIGGSTSSSNWSVRTARTSLGSWRFSGRSLQLMDPLSMQAMTFGQSLSRDGDWLFVGAPSTSGLPGVVYAYQKAPQGSYRFHSLLPDPVVPASTSLLMDSIGTQIASSGGRVAVSTTSRLFSIPAVILYAWDAATESWVQESIVSPPARRSGSGFGTALVLSGNFLAVGAPGDRHVYLYSRTGTTWNFVTELTAPPAASTEAFGHALSLSAQRLLIGSPQMGKGSAYLFEQKNGTWKQTARLAPPPGLYVQEMFGQTVSLDGDRALVAGGRSFTLGHMYRRTSTGWKHHMDLPWQLTSETRTAVFADSLVLVNTDIGTYPCGLSKDRWVNQPLLTSYYNAPAGLLVDGTEAIFGGEESFSVSSHVTVQSLVRPPHITWSGDAVEDPRQAGVTHLEAGEYLVGAKVDRWLGFNTRNASMLPTRVTAAVSGDTADASLSASSWDLGIAGEAGSWLRLHPKTAGEKSITLHFSDPASTAAPITYMIHFQVVTQATPLSFEQIPESALLQGSTVEHALYASVSGTRPWSFRWLKNGSGISGQTTPVLPIHTPGSYRVEVTGPAGKITSPAAAIGTYEEKTSTVYARLGQTARLSVAVAGPGIHVRWSGYNDADYGPLTDGATYSGTRSPTLTIRRAQPELNGSYTATIILPTPDGPLEAEEHMTFTLTKLPQATLAGVDDGRLYLTEPVRLQCGVDFNGDRETSPAFSITGLPPGLTMNANGTITGTPARAGQFRVTLTVRIGPHTSPALVRTFVVTEPGLFSPGLYWGWVEQSGDFPLAGAITVDLRPDGSYTGSLLAGSRKHPLAGRLTDANDQTSDPVRLAHAFESSIPFVGWIQASSPELKRLQFFIKPENSDDSSIQLLSELRLIKPLILSSPPTLDTGKHSFAIGPGPNWIFQPGGYGFGTLTITADRRGTFAGQLADGRGITGAGWLADESTESTGLPDSFHFYTTADRGTGSVRGSVVMSTVDHPEGEHVTWTQLPTQGRIYSAGFDEAYCSWHCTRYQQQDAVRVFQSFVPQLWLTLGDLGTLYTPFQFNGKLQATFRPGFENNLLKARLDVYAPTGFFTGQFTLTDPDPKDDSRTLSRIVQYRGMLLPGMEYGYGYFLLPSLPDPYAIPPTTTASSPIYSGPAQIGP